MATRGSREKTVPVSIDLPEALHGWLAHVAHQKGLTVGEHIRSWIIASLEPWEEPPLPLDAGEVIEIPDEIVPGGWKPAEDDRPKRADFPDDVSFLKAERAERQARGAATRKRNRETHPPPMPEHLLRIAEARKLHPMMSIPKFSQLLFDQNIYPSQADGTPIPVERTKLTRWLKKLQEAGLLSQP